jgi:hypothetical protein
VKGVNHLSVPAEGPWVSSPPAVIEDAGSMRAVQFVMCAPSKCGVTLYSKIASHRATPQKRPRTQSAACCLSAALTADPVADKNNSIRGAWDQYFAILPFPEVSRIP